MNKTPRQRARRTAGHYLDAEALVALLLLLARRGKKPTGAECARTLGVSTAAIYRLLATAERDLGLVVRGRQRTGGLAIHDWGVFSRRKLLEWSTGEKRVVRK